MPHVLHLTLFLPFSSPPPPFSVILTEVDKLSKQAQAGLRRTMEKYSQQCRIILICNSPSKIIEPVRSRCLGVRVPSATVEEISEVLQTVAKKEIPGMCPPELSLRIASSCERNLRRALLMLEAAKVQSSGAGRQLMPDQAVQLPDWELYIQKMAREVLAEQSPAKLLAARDMLYELLTNCIPADVIIQTLTRELMKGLDDSLKHEVAHWAAYYEHRLRRGSKEIFHLEAYIAKFMAVYKKWLISFFDF